MRCSPKLSSTLRLLREPDGIVKGQLYTTEIKPEIREALGTHTKSLREQEVSYRLDEVHCVTYIEGDLATLAAFKT